MTPSTEMIEQKREMVLAEEVSEWCSKEAKERMYWYNIDFKRSAIVVYTSLLSSFIATIRASSGFNLEGAWLGFFCCFYCYSCSDGRTGERLPVLSTLENEPCCCL
jgi:hypothetical protein